MPGIVSFETGESPWNRHSHFSPGGGCHLKGERLSKWAWPPFSRDLNTVPRPQDRLKTIPRLSFSVPRVHFDPTRGILLFRVAGFYSFSPNSMFQLGEEFAQLGEEFVQLGESLGELGESLNGVGEKSVQVGVKSVDLGESNSGNSS
jgi:hypothetical protein